MRSILDFVTFIVFATLGFAFVNISIYSLYFSDNHLYTFTFTFFLLLVSVSICIICYNKSKFIKAISFDNLPENHLKKVEGLFQILDEIEGNENQFQQDISNRYKVQIRNLVDKYLNSKPRTMEANEAVEDIFTQGLLSLERKITEAANNNSISNIENLKVYANFVENSD